MAEPMGMGVALSEVEGLSAADRAALLDLYQRGTPPNTLRAYERDLIYVTAWKIARFGIEPAWPEAEHVALRFVLDHSVVLTDADPEDAGRRAAEALIDQGLRRSLGCPAPATLDRRIASWRTFHRMRNLPSPFDAPALRAARAKARRATAHRPERKSKHPITRDIVEGLIATCGSDLRGLRDAAVILTGWASGGRRRSEIAGLLFDSIDFSSFEEANFLRLSLLQTKTTDADKTPGLVLKGRAAQALVTWVKAASIGDGFLFRAVSKSGRVLDRGLSSDGIAYILRQRLQAAGLPAGVASAHGLRSGFLTQAALDGAPMAAAMRLSLHRSAAEAQRYYDDVDVSENPAADLLG